MFIDCTEILSACSYLNLPKMEITKNDFLELEASERTEVTD
jgi:hypothetical protein